MKSMLMAVFGHYDSRGGTTGIPIRERDALAVRETFKQYNRAFYWEPENDPDKAEAWQLEAGASPAEQDFMFVAELWHEDDADIAGDLEEYGAVLINESTEPAFSGADRGEFCGEMLNLLIKLTLKRPVQLEFVAMEGGKYAEQERVEPPIDGTVSHVDQHRREEQAWTKHVQGLPKKIGKDTATGWVFVKDRDWNDDAFGFMIGTGE